MAEDQDKYFIAYDALWKKGEGAVPFQVLTNIEIKSISHDGIADTFLHYEDLITGEKQIHKANLRMGRPQTVWNPFTRKGPYFVNSIESAIKEFRTDIEGDNDV